MLQLNELFQVRVIRLEEFVFSIIAEQHECGDAVSRNARIAAVIVNSVDERVKDVVVVAKDEKIDETVLIDIIGTGEEDDAQEESMLFDFDIRFLRDDEFETSCEGAKERIGLFQTTSDGEDINAKIGPSFSKD